MHATQSQMIEGMDESDDDFGGKDDWILAEESKDEGLVKLFAQAIENQISRNARTKPDVSLTTSFHGHKAPAITVTAYIERIANLSNCSPCCFVLAWRFLKQIQAKDAQLYLLSELNIHRLVLTTVMIAAKFMDDLYYSNQYWAKVGGVPNDELNSLEIEMLFLLSFNLHVRRREYQSTLDEILDYQKQCNSNDILAIVDGVISKMLSDFSERCPCFEQSLESMQISIENVRQTCRMNVRQNQADGALWQFRNTGCKSNIRTILLRFYALLPVNLEQHCKTVKDAKDPIFVPEKRQL